MDDPYDLQRFVEAQEWVYDDVVRELSAGQKLTHWMWFIFPQIEGLGDSSMSRQYAISSLAEAGAYMDHEILGARLRQSARLVNEVTGRHIEDIFHTPDHMKFHSSMTLFSLSTADNGVFREAIEKYFDGQPHTLTLGILGIAAAE